MRDKAWRKKQEADHDFKKKFSKKGKPKQEKKKRGKVALEEVLKEEEEDARVVCSDE